MGALKTGGRLAALLALLALAGCVSQAPVTIPGAFKPPPRSVLGPSKTPAQTCIVRIGDVKDLRGDKRAAGSLSGRTIYLGDSEAWLRSGLATLKRDARLKLVTEVSPGDLVLNAELVNAYMSQRTGTEKSTTIVFKTRFERDAAILGEEIIRGHVDNVNWNATDSEILEAFDLTMQDAIVALDQSVIARCKI